MKNLTALISIFILVNSSLYGQLKHYCGTVEMDQKLVASDPSILERRMKLETLTKEYVKNNYKKKGAVKIVPIVFHIIHNYGSENISKQKVLDGLKMINDDFRKLNADTSDVVNDFKSIIADCEIEFRLAQKDPNGNCTDGITRTASTQTYTADDGVKDLIRWPNNMYLNVWLVQSIGSGAGGYAYYPGAGPSVDGIVVRSAQFGSGYRTLTHEIGHWINLRHTWGNSNNAGDAGNCSGDDDVSDTPNTIGNFGCDLAVTSCSSLDNIQNYMDYTSCSRMFTEGQKTRMLAALSGFASGRNNLSTPSNLIATGTNAGDLLCNLDFSADQIVICAGSQVNFTDESYNGQTGWSWYFEGATPSGSGAQNPAVMYNTPGVYDVSLSVTNGVDIMADIKTDYIRVLPSVGNPVPFFESFESESATAENWYNITYDNANTWQEVGYAGYTGSRCYLMDNWSGNEDGRYDDLISPAIDLSEMESLVVSFKVAFAQIIDTTNDVLRLYVSDDCGESWALKWVENGSNLATVPAQSFEFIPASQSEWVEHSITNIGASYFTDVFRLKFQFISEGGNHLYLDDINIRGVSNTIPMLVSPLNTTVGLSPSNVTLDWDAVDNVDQYEYGIDTSSNFSSPELINGTKNFISFVDNGIDTEHDVSNLLGNTTYYWRVRTVTSAVNSTWSAVWNFSTSSLIGMANNDNEPGIDLVVFPNPLNGNSTISYYLNQPVQQVALHIFDVTGRKLATLAEGSFKAGEYSFPTQNFLSNSGVYYVKLEIGSTSQVRKIIVL